MTNVAWRINWHAKARELQEINTEILCTKLKVISKLTAIFLYQSTYYQNENVIHWSQERNGLCLLQSYSDNLVQYYEVCILDYVPATQDYVLRISFAATLCW
jgi:hypothetical protein